MAGHLRRYRLNTPDEYDDIVALREDSWPTLAQFLRFLRRSLPSFKMQLRIKVLFHRDVEFTSIAEAYFNSHQVIVLPTSTSRTAVDQMFADIQEKINSWCNSGSNWVVDRLAVTEFHVVRYRPLRGGSYIRLPLALQKKKGFVNIKNYNNDMCFVWCVVAALKPPNRNPSRVLYYQRALSSLQAAKQIDCSGLQYPTSFSEIKLFEENNKLRINVYGYDNEEKTIQPLMISSSNANTKINLLLLKSGKNRHFVLIKDLNKFLASQRKGHRKKFFCPICLQNQSNDTIHRSHVLSCRFGNPGMQKIRMPSKERSEMKFISTKKQQRLGLVMYGDFECKLEPFDTCSPSPSTSSTTPIQQHVPSGCSLVAVKKCCDEVEYPKIYTYRGNKAVDKFLDNVISTAENYQKDLDSASKYPLLDNSEENRFLRATDCHICGESLDLCSRCETVKQSYERCNECKRKAVRDHCHCCSKFRSAAHNKCNILLKQSRDVAVCLHNLRRYDSHLIMRRLGSAALKRNIDLDCIPKSAEDYIMFSLKMKWKNFTYKIRFIDSFQFMPASLENLVSILKKQGDSHFSLMKHCFSNKHQRQILLRKGIFCYEYMTSSSKFEEKSLPPIADFYSKLTGTGITPEEYAHAQRVWKMMKIENLGQYQDLYVKTDTLLLADVFENFRSFCLSNYKLDPANYVTLPGIAWDACLRMSNTTLQLLTDKEMYEFIESGIRGGYACIVKRFAKANNPYIHDFNPKDPISYILYLDANNLYGCAMVQMMPVRNFRWLCKREIDDLPDVRDIRKDSKCGIILEVDLSYPDNLHDLHDDFPLAPEKMTLSEDKLSPYCRRVGNDTSSTEVPKLIASFRKKTKYVLHYQNLQLYLKQGLVLDKIHRVLHFEQEAWMKPYISFNTEMRKQATSDFEKDLFKLLNNAVFGKSMENVRKYVDVKLVTNPEYFQRLVAKPNYVESEVFTEDFVAVLMQRSTCTLSKPIYVGFTILELSKRLIYKFHYNYMKRKFPQCELLFTDTDSLTYFVETPDLYRSLESDIDKHFDTSNYEPSHFLFNEKNKKRIGVMKDETAGIPIHEFVGLRPKMYSFLFGNKNSKRAKGVKKSVVKNVLRHIDYKRTLFKEKRMRHKMTYIRNKFHNITTVETIKISLSCFDNKRFILNDGINSLAYDHCRIDDL